MRTPNSAREVLKSLPIEVRFAGFTSNTLSLANSGWDLSMQEGHSYNTAEYEMRLAIRHEGARLYGITYPLRVEHRDLYELMGNPIGFGKYLATRWFEMQAVAPGIQFQRLVERGGARLADMFKPIDANPQFAETEDMKDFRFFKTANPSVKDIIVLPEMVPDLLAKVLEAQRPAMDEIRKRERSRENLTAYREAMMLDSIPMLKPAHDVQIQLVTMAS